MSTNTPHSPRRRRLLIAGLGAAVVATTGAVWLGSRLADRHAWIENVLRAHLPGVELDPESLATFVAQFARHPLFDDRNVRIAAAVDRALPAATASVDKIARIVDRIERRLISDYLTGSNFFSVSDPRKETIVYAAAMPACGNPFAMFRDA